MRYFVIQELHPQRIVAMADEQALGRVVADYLAQYVVGSQSAGANVTVREVREEEFRAYARSGGSVAV